MLRTATRGRLLLAVAAFLLMLQGIAFSTPSVAQDRPTLRLGVNAADLQTLDPHYASGTHDRTVVDMIFNGLVRYTPGDANSIEPDIATEIPEPTMDGDVQVWTFNLRDDVMCHPWEGGEGYQLTSADVVASLEKASNPDTSGYSADYAGMSFEAVDDLTVAIRVETPLSPTLFLPKVANYNGGFVICAQAYEALGAEGFITNPVGTGPFMFESYTPQTSVKLVANDAYFRGAPQIAGVDVSYMPDSASRDLALQSGELDVIAGLPEAQWAEQISADGTYLADIFGPVEIIWLNLNIEHEALSNLQVRQAIAHAIDRGEHQALFGSPVGEEVFSVVPEPMPGALTQEEAEAAGAVFAFDPDMARELLAEAGFADGLTISVVTSEMSDYRANYEVLQAELSDIGIDFQVEVVDHATMHAQIREDVNPIVIYVASRPNPDVILTQFFLSDSIVVTGASPVTNFSHYSAVDDLILQARAETDPDAQAELWKQAVTQIQTDVAAIPLVSKALVYARTQNVDFGHELISVRALYPGIDETTTISS